jgi:hypothetical protein
MKSDNHDTLHSELLRAACAVFFILTFPLCQTDIHTHTHIFDMKCTSNKISSGQVNFCALYFQNHTEKIFTNNYSTGAEPPPSNISNMSMPSDWFVQIMW